jgi:tRNA G18 (ribose-2'-O)-methylase SpoU
MKSVAEVSVRLPMAGRADSLNVAQAAAVMIYEMVRRGGATEGGQKGAGPGD